MSTGQPNTMNIIDDLISLLNFNGAVREQAF
jgi:hypothetical protein